MKNHLPFDQHFKNQLEDVESFVPDNMFEKIMAERKRKSNFALFFQNNSLKFGLAACAVLAATGLLYLKSGSKKVQQPVASAALPNHEVQTVVAQTPPLTPVDAPQNPISYQPKTLKSNVLDKNTLAGNEQIVLETPVPKQTKVVVPSANLVALQPISVVPTIRLDENPAALQANLTLFENQSVAEVENQSVAKANQDAVEANQVKNQAIAETAQVENQAITETEQIENQNVAPVKQVRNPKTTLITKRQAKSSIAHLPTKGVWNVKSIARMTGPEINCPNFNLRKPSRWYIDIWGSPDYAFRKLYNTQDENTPYAKTRDSVEHSWYAFSAGARVSLVLESGVAVRAGLNYLQNNEIFDYKKTGEVRTRTITESVKQPDGSIITNTRTEIQYGTYQLKKYNRYRSIDVPIQLGYEFGSMPWSYSINGGINFNLTSWRKAQILNPALVPWDASKNEVNVFKSNVGASLYASFAAYYDWKDYTQLFVEPYIRHFLSPITTKDYTVEQRYTDVGLKLGVRWRL